VSCFGRLRLGGQGQGAVPPAGRPGSDAEDSPVKRSASCRDCVSAWAGRRSAPRGGIVKGWVHEGPRQGRTSSRCTMIDSLGLSRRLEQAPRRAAQRKTSLRERPAQRRSRRGARAGALISVKDNDNLRPPPLHRAEADMATAAIRCDTARGQSSNYAHISAPISGRSANPRDPGRAGCRQTRRTRWPPCTTQLDHGLRDVSSRAGRSGCSCSRELAEGGKGGWPSRGAPPLEDGTAYPQGWRVAVHDVVPVQRVRGASMRLLCLTEWPCAAGNVRARDDSTKASMSNALLAPQVGITREPKGNASDGDRP